MLFCIGGLIKPVCLRPYSVVLLLYTLQVVYPALDSKVKNVTLAYMVEHEDEVECA